MSFNKRFFPVGGIVASSQAAVCNTDSVQAFGADSAFSSNIALYQLDGDGGVANNVPDTTGDFNGTASNITYATGQFGNAAVFNGSSSSILLPNNILSSDFSISTWFNLDDTDGVQTVLELDYENRVIFRAVSTSSNFAYIGNSGYFNHGISFSAGQWYHLVITFSAGNPFKIYVNGVLSYTGGNTNVLSNNNENLIGAGNSNGANCVDGKIDQLRIFNRAITAEEVSTLYNETTSTASNTNPLSDGSGVALYSLDYDASDAGGLYEGTPTDVDFGVDGQINYGARFNGSSSNIDTGGDLVNSLTAITVSGWFYTEPNTNYSYGLNFGTIGSDGDAISISRWNNTASGGFGAYTLYSNIGSASVDGNYTLNEDTWYHIAITWTGTTMKFYVNGNLETTASTSSLSIPASGNSGYIGRFITNQSYNWKGDIDQVRIFNRALDSDEVDTLFAEEACVYTSTTDIVNYPTGTTPVAYYKLDNSSEDETGSYDGTETNIEYRFGRFGQAAVFNGSSSAIVLPNNILSSDFSISTWFNLDSNTGVQTLMEFDYENRVLFRTSSTDSNLAYIGNSGYFNHGLSFSTGQWYHLVITFSAGNPFKIYVDGVLSYTGGNTSVSAFSNDNIIGAANSSGGGGLDGKIDQVRIYDAALTSDQVTELYNEKPEVDTSNFKTVLYDGNSGHNYISNVGMDLETNGGLVWIKTRNQSVRHLLTDSVRGTASQIFSNETLAEQNYLEFTSFDANGFTLDYNSGTQYFNNTNSDYVGWVWKGGGDAVSNTDGSITSQVSANTDAGFSIVKYTGNSTDNATVGHGLSVAPNLVIVKDLDSSNYWCVGGSTVGDGENLYLNVTTERQTRDRVKSVQTDTFTLGSHFEVNSTNDFIAYCFHSVSGYSKIGSYSGTGSTGNAITGLGFQPNWLMVKRTDASGNSWLIVDNRRVESNGNLSELFANATTAESGTGYDIDFTSDGFTLNTTTTNANASGTDNYIYMAFK